MSLPFVVKRLYSDAGNRYESAGGPGLVCLGVVLARELAGAGGAGRRIAWVA